MDEFTFTKGCINKDNTLTITVLNVKDGTTNEIIIDAANDANDDFILKLIDKSNRHYSAMLHHLGMTEETENYGCLTTKVIGLKELPLTFVDAKYVINIFLKLLQCFFHEKEEEKYYHLCGRDEESLKIPTSKTNISSLIKEIMNACAEAKDDEDDIIDIKYLFIAVLNYMSDLSATTTKNINSKNHKINIGGGANILKEFNKSIENNIEDTLNQTGNNIHNLIRDYKRFIYNNDSACHENLNAIHKWIEEQPLTCLYQNTNISFKFMMEFVSNVFNALFLEILPQTSMINCLFATLYQASVLNELSILKHQSESIQLPLLYRLIYSCFKCDINNNNNNNDQQSSIDYFQLIDKLCKQEKDIDVLCKIALKVNITEPNQLNSLFWLLNEKRGYTFEFYLIVLISLYIKFKCATLNKTNKLSNGRMFGEPLYDILYKFYHYVTSDLGKLEIALCTNTFTNFNTVYSNDIKKCLQTFFKNANYGEQKRTQTLRGV